MQEEVSLNQRGCEGNSSGRILTAQNSHGGVCARGSLRIERKHVYKEPRVRSFNAAFKPLSNKGPIT